MMRKKQNDSVECIILHESHLFCHGNNNNVLTQRTLSIFQNVTQECLMSDSRAYICNGNRFTMCLPSSVYSSSSAPPSAEWEKKMKE